MTVIRLIAQVETVQQAIVNPYGRPQALAVIFVAMTAR